MKHYKMLELLDSLTCMFVEKEEEFMELDCSVQATVVRCTLHNVVDNIEDLEDATVEELLYLLGCATSFNNECVVYSDVEDYINKEFEVDEVNIATICK